MFNRTIFYMILIVVTILSGIAFGKSGRIVSVDDDGNGGYIIVKVRGEGTLWVGCTVYPAGHGKYEVDLKPVKVRGSDEAKFNVLPRMDFSKRSLDYVVALWEDKISLRKCKKKYGKGSDRCRWARKNGYQMEGRLDRKQGSYRPGFN